MLYVIAVLMPPAALFLSRKPGQALIAFAGYFLMGCVAVDALHPGLFSSPLPIFIFWFGVLWFVPAMYAVAVVKAQKTGKRAPERVDYVFALRRLAVTAPVIFVAIPAACLAFFWAYAAYHLREQIDDWAKMPDSTVKWDSTTIEGFPFSARFRLTNVTFGAARPLPYQLSAPLLIIEAPNWFGNDYHIALRASRHLRHVPEPWFAHDVRVALPQGATLAVPTLALAMGADDIAATVDSNGHNPTLIAFGAQHVWRREAASPLDIETVYGRLQMPGRSLATERKDFLGGYVVLDRISLSHALPPLSDTIDSVQISGEFHGAWPPGSLRDALATWRDAGGYVGLKLGELYWDEFHVKVYDGLLKLDRALQPTGSFMASATNEATAVDAMVAAGGLSAQEADAVKAILASLVQPAADGSPHLLQKVQIGNNRMTLGATEIFALPRIVWP